LRAQRFAIVRPAGRPAVIASRVVPALGRASLQFVAPAAGSYRMTAPGHPQLEGEIRFAVDGTRSATIRIQESQHRFERVGPRGLSEVAHRIADASHRADHAGRVTLESLF